MSEFKHCMLFSISEIKYLARCTRLKHGQQQAIDQVAYIANAACNTTISINGQRLIEQCLGNEIRDHAAIIELTIGAVGIENAHNTRIELILPVVFHGQRFAKTLAFIITCTWPNRIDVAPVIFALWMHERISICF